MCSSAKPTPGRPTTGKTRRDAGRLQLFAGLGRGPTFVVPFSMGPPALLSYIGVEITDSPYVAVSMRTMTRAGTLCARGARGRRVRAVHDSVGAPLEQGDADVVAVQQRGEVDCPLPRDPPDLVAWVGVGCNAPSSARSACAADRLRDRLRRGWLAEHMLILKLTNPEASSGQRPRSRRRAARRIFAMLIPTVPGWEAETVGDDIAWMKFGDDGRLYAINPEFGFFGVASARAWTRTRTPC